MNLISIALGCFVVIASYPSQSKADVLLFFSPHEAIIRQTAEGAGYEKIPLSTPMFEVMRKVSATNKVLLLKCHEVSRKEDTRRLIEMADCESGVSKFFDISSRSMKSASEALSGCILRICNSPVTNGLSKMKCVGLRFDGFDEKNDEAKIKITEVVLRLSRCNNVVLRNHARSQVLIEIQKLFRLDDVLRKMDVTLAEGRVLPCSFNLKISHDSASPDSMLVDIVSTRKTTNIKHFVIKSLASIDEVVAAISGQ